jgi:hypothetical protein
MPVKPWALGPRKSLNIFGGLGEVMDARAARQQAAEEQQQRLEDRLAAKEMQTLQKRSLEQALADRAKPQAPKIIGQKEDPVTGDVFNLYDDGTSKPVTLAGGGSRMPVSGSHDPAQTLRLGRKPADEPLETVMRDGKRVLVRRSEAAGMEAPSPSSAGDRVLVQVAQPDGSVVYMPRDQAAGMQAPRAGAGAAEMAKRQQALANVTDAIAGFKQTLSGTGSRVMPGVDKSTLETSYENLQLQMKELFNLGVLNGPDLALMRRVLSNPTDIKGRMLAGGSADEQTRRTQAQIAEVEKIIAKYQANLQSAMRPAGGGRAGGGGPAAAAPKPPAADPEFEALMAKYGRPPV